LPLPWRVGRTNEGAAPGDRSVDTTTEVPVVREAPHRGRPGRDGVIRTQDLTKVYGGEITAVEDRHRCRLDGASGC
jgi:hypothetical protein